MSQGGGGYARLEVVASANKLEGWKRYQDSRDVFLRVHNWATRRELLDLHGVVCAPSENGLLRERSKDLRFALATQDRKDGAELEDRMRVFARKNPGASFEDVCTALYSLACERITGLQLETRTTGVLRTLGTRTFASGEKETVYASHTCTFGGDAENLRGYLSFSSDLQRDHLFFYEKLCGLFDEKMKAARTLEEKLKAIAWFQIVGTRLIHPPWDGTGRTFSAHLDLTLARIGFEEGNDENARAWLVERCNKIKEVQAWQSAQQKYPGISRQQFEAVLSQTIHDHLERDSPRALLIGRVLADFSNYILRRALKDNGLGYVHIPPFPLMLSHSNRLAYMKALGKGISDALEKTDERTLETTVAYLTNLVRAPLEIVQVFSALMEMCFRVPDSETEAREIETFLDSHVTQDGFVRSPSLLQRLLGS